MQILPVHVSQDDPNIDMGTNPEDALVPSAETTVGVRTRIFKFC